MASAASDNSFRGACAIHVPLDRALRVVAGVGRPLESRRINRMDKNEHKEDV